MDNSNQKSTSNQYQFGNSNYEVTRIFSGQKSIKDIIQEKLTIEKQALQN